MSTSDAPYLIARSLAKRITRPLLKVTQKRISGSWCGFHCARCFLDQFSSDNALATGERLSDAGEQRPKLGARPLTPKAGTNG